MFSKNTDSNTITVSDKFKLAKIALQQDSVSFNKYFEQVCKDKIRYLRFLFIAFLLLLVCIKFP